MILVDTSLWIDHLREADERLTQLLTSGQVLAHPFVTGELALGNLRNRAAVLGALQDLPQVSVATEPEVLHLIASQGLFGLGIGYIDAHLLASVMLTPGALLWTRDKRLMAAGAQLGVAAHTTQH
jgi:predicted nucleic acid-binding protein